MFKKWLIIFFGPLLFSCNYLDIVPDNVATVDHIFRMRSTTEQYLFAMYSYLPNYVDAYNYHVFLGGDELGANDYNVNQPALAWQIAKGFQNVVNPYSNYWIGTTAAAACSWPSATVTPSSRTSHKAPDMDDYEKNRWAAEALFLKAYFHFYLFPCASRPYSADRKEPAHYQQYRSGESEPDAGGFLREFHCPPAGRSGGEPARNVS